MLFPGKPILFKIMKICCLSKPKRTSPLAEKLSFSQKDTEYFKFKILEGSGMPAYEVYLVCEARGDPDVSL